MHSQRVSGCIHRSSLYNTTLPCHESSSRYCCCSQFGYLQARGTAPELGESIYIPQHPGGKPSRIATLLDNQTIGTIESTSIQTCSPDEVGYSLDTAEPGASGSPVISTKDNTVTEGGPHCSPAPYNQKEMFPKALVSVLLTVQSWGRDKDQAKRLHASYCISASKMVAKGQRKGTQYELK
ncbi:hypothetical protein AeMF1_013212 [Aphanomyces euteiches]|nr:hypothetical protein AeMF1_013212 [Aphanomyces euteiches]